MVKRCNMTAASLTGVISPLVAMSSLVGIAVSLAGILPSVVQSQTVEWAQSGGTALGVGGGIAVDAAGNTFVTGSFAPTATFGSFMLTSAGDTDIFVAKYDSSGNALWARSAGGPSYDDPFGEGDIAVDADGNSYVASSFQDAATFGPFTLTSAGGAGSTDIFVAKYDSSGNILWARSAGAAGIDGYGQAVGISVDTAGNSYITGVFDQTVSFGPFTLTSAGVFDIFVAKYDNTGNVLWARSAGGQDSDFGGGIAVDAAGNSYVTGRFSGTATFDAFTLTSPGKRSIFVVKFDGGGGVIWARMAGGTLQDAGYGIAVDADGNSYVTGKFQGKATFGPFTLTSAGEPDIFVVKFDDGGSVIWARSAGGTESDFGVGVAVDAAGNSYVTGRFENMASLGPYTLTSVGFGNLFVAKYDASGNVIWAQSSSGTSQGLGIAVDAAGSSFVTGGFSGTVAFCPFTLTSPDANWSDIFLAKYVLFSECDSFNIDQCEDCDGGLGCKDCLCPAGFEPTVPPSLDCNLTCGTGSIGFGEECDDGNADDGDGCSSTCTIEQGWDCTGEPSDCTFTCGDSVIDAREECDDGNTDDGDGCSATCSVEPASSCTGEPSVCITIPAVSQWGLVAMTLLMLTAGTIVVARRRSVAPGR